MLKVQSTEYEDSVNLDVEDDTEDFEQMGIELAALIRYAYDTVSNAAGEGGARDPEREARLFIDQVINDAINGEMEESEESRIESERGKILKLVDDYMDKKDDE